MAMACRANQLLRRGEIPGRTIPAELPLPLLSWLPLLAEPYWPSISAGRLAGPGAAATAR